MSELATTPAETEDAAPEPAPRRPHRRPWTLIAGRAALLVVLLLLPLYLPPGLLSAGQYVMIGAVGAMGLTLVIGQAGLLSLAHAFFLLVVNEFKLVNDQYGHGAGDSVLEVVAVRFRRFTRPTFLRPSRQFGRRAGPRIEARTGPRRPSGGPGGPGARGRNLSVKPRE